MQIHGFFLTAAALLCSQGALAQTQADEHAGRRLYATCAACHGTEGRPVAGSSLPSLAGQPKDVLITSMKAFQEGRRPATIMQQLAKGYTSEQIELIAAYLAVSGK